MKKNILLVLIFMIIFNVKAQNIALSDFNDNDVTGGELTVQGSPSDDVLEIGLKVINTSSSTIDIKVKKEEVVVISGSENYFCWGNCYTPDVFVSTDFIPIDAGATNTNSFKGDYRPYKNEGQTSIRYTFFNKADEEDKVSVLVKFNASSSTNVSLIKNSKNYVSKAFPVPAKDFVTIKYNFKNVSNVKLEIYNLQGVKFNESNINRSNGEYKLYSKSYQKGVYLYQFTEKGKLIDSGKIVFQ